jgi:hypothetical protein
MAVYRGPERRRRMGAAIAVAALIAGLLLGVVIGRATAPSLDDKVAEGRSAGRDLVASLRVLPLEYRQAAAGSSETGTIEDTVKRAAGRLPAALDAAPWLGAGQRTAATDAVRAIEAAARAKVPPARFDATIARSTATLQSIFGLPPSAGDK